jgi:hypothetical protein
MRGPANKRAVELNAFDVGDNEIADVTIAASAGEYWVLDSIQYGYSQAPSTRGFLVVSFADVTKMGLYVPVSIGAAGPHTIRFPKGFYTGTKNEKLIVSLSGGGAGTFGVVNITYR